MTSLRLALIVLLLAPSLSGCLVVGTAALATDVAIGTVGTAVDVGAAAIDVVIPGDDEDEDEDEEDR